MPQLVLVGQGIACGVGVGQRGLEQGQQERGVGAVELDEVLDLAGQAAAGEARTQLAKKKNRSSLSR
jgi:hypothetical protein